MTAELTGRVALVTGAARGMGAAEARLLHQHGARVVLADVLDDEGSLLAAEFGDRARFVHLDVTDEDNWRAAVEETTRHFGRLDILVNNAGVYSTRPLLDETVERLGRHYLVNVVGAFLGIREAAPVMTACGGGSIINISSTAALTGYPEHGAYAASKWALRGLTKVAAVELGASGIRVNSVHPGAVDTPMISALVRQAAKDGVPGPSPLLRFGTAQEVAELVVFLAGERASYINGAELAVDGGATAGPAA